MIIVLCIFNKQIYGHIYALNKSNVNYSHFVCALPEHVLPLFSTPREKVHCCGELLIPGVGGFKTHHMFTQDCGSSFHKIQAEIEREKPFSHKRRNKTTSYKPQNLRVYCRIASRLRSTTLRKLEFFLF